MRICLLGDFSGTPDEGMKKISKTVRDKLSLRHNVLALNSRDVFKKTFVNTIRSFRPEVIHYLHGPTICSLVLMKGLKIISGNKVRVISSATRPYFSRYSKWAIPILTPDLKVFLKQMASVLDFSQRFLKKYRQLRTFRL